MRKTVIALVGVMGLTLFVGQSADAAKKSRSCVCAVGGDFSGNLNCTTTGSLSNGKFRCQVSRGDGDGEGEGRGEGKCDDEDGCKKDKDKGEGDGDEKKRKDPVGPGTGIGPGGF